MLNTSAPLVTMVMPDGTHHPITITHLGWEKNTVVLRLGEAVPAGGVIKLSPVVGSLVVEMMVQGGQHHVTKARSAETVPHRSQRHIRSFKDTQKRWRRR